MDSKDRFAWLAALGVCALVAGCAGRPALFPNSDPTLRKTSTQFAADATTRFPYPATAPKAGNADGRAQVDPTLMQLQILNASAEDWDEVDVWVNHGYVCHVTRMEKGKQKVKTLTFQMLYDQNGNHFWTNRGDTPMKTVEIYRSGKLYNVPLVLAD